MRLFRRKHKKYELTDERTYLNGHTLYRIRALCDFVTVTGKQIHAGDLGGFIESRQNLSQNGVSWVGKLSFVFGQARIFENAYVGQMTTICDNAQIYGNAHVGDARVDSRATYIGGNAQVFESARLVKTDVAGDVQIYGNAVCDGASVHGTARVCGSTSLYNVHIKVEEGGNIDIYDRARLRGNDNDTITVVVKNGNTKVCDFGDITESLTITGDRNIEFPLLWDRLNLTQRERAYAEKYSYEHDCFPRYVLTDQMIQWEGHTLYRIRALCDFVTSTGKQIHAGDLGGFIEQEGNLCHDGTAWVADDAKVYGNAKVSGHSLVEGKAQVYGNAKIYGFDGTVSDNAIICDDAVVYDGEVSGNAKVYGSAVVRTATKIRDNAEVFGDAVVERDSDISGHAKVYGNTYLTMASVSDSAEVYGNSTLGVEERERGRIHDAVGRTIVKDNAKVHSDAVLYPGRTSKGVYIDDLPNWSENLAVSFYEDTVNETEPSERHITGPIIYSGDCTVTVGGDAEVCAQAKVFAGATITEGVITKNVSSSAEILKKSNPLYLQVMQAPPTTVLSKSGYSLTFSADNVNE